MTEKEFCIDFAKSLRVVMHKYNLNATSLARTCDLPKSSVTRYLRGERMPSAMVIAKMVYFIGCTADELIDVYEEW